MCIRDRGKCEQSPCSQSVHGMKPIVILKRESTEDAQPRSQENVALQTMEIGVSVSQPPVENVSCEPDSISVVNRTDTTLPKTKDEKEVTV